MKMIVQEENNMKDIIIIICLLLVLSSDIFAQMGSAAPSNAKAMGLGNGGNANRDGVFAIGRNPASIINSKDSMMLEFTFPSFGVSAYADIMPIDKLNYFFGGKNNLKDSLVGRYLTDDDKKEILSNFDENGLIGFNTEVDLFSIGFMPSQEIGAFAFGIRENVSVGVTMPSDFLNFIFYGNKEGNTYNFEDFEIDATWLRSYNLSYARQVYTSKTGMIRALNGGITLKMYQGMAYYNLSTENASFSTGRASNGFPLEFLFNAKAVASGSRDLTDLMNPNGITDGKFSISPDQAGSGFGVDLGINFETDFGLIGALSVTDMGSMAWDLEVDQVEYNIEKNWEIGGDNPDINGPTEDEVNELIKGGERTVTNPSSVDGELPTVLRFGVMAPVHQWTDIWGELNILFDYNQGFNNSMGNTTTPIVSLGVDWKFHKYIPHIITGFSNDPIGNFRWSMGLGYSLPAMDFYVSTQDILSLSPSTHGSVAMSFRWKIF